jgi:membrane fusion protein (multidrug efflux system)
MNDRSFPDPGPPAIRLARPGLAAALVLSLACCGKAPVAAPAPVDVTVTTVQQSDVPVTQEWVASLTGFVDAQVRAQVSGNLTRQDYAEGGPVRKGDLLFEIDPRPFQAALAQAEAQLAQAEAQVGKTEEDVTRYLPLAREQAISQQELDDAVQANLAAKAEAASARAAVQTAQLNLDFARILSPVDGVAGIAKAEVGDLVGPNSGVLAIVSTVNPMKVYFSISEQSYLDFMRAHPDSNGISAPVSFTLILSDGSLYPYPGTFYAADNQIDPDTGTLQIVALFPNPKGLLKPGQFGKVRAVVRVIKGALLVPEAALAELQGGYQVVTVDDANKAHLQIVKAGARIGGMAVIEGGVKPGDRIVVDGIQKMREGIAVNPQPYVPAP